MDRASDTFMALAAGGLSGGLSPLERPHPPASATAGVAPAIGRLQGFDVLERPLVSGLAACPGEVVPARTAVALQHSMIGREVVVIFGDGDVRVPVITGVIESDALAGIESRTAAVAVHVDGERYVIDAQREITLRCGEASITLTRAGKVIICGRYILSRSSGCNKIKGAVVDIN